MLAVLQEKALAYAREAGEVTLRYFRTDTAVDMKSDNSPVTQADREAEALIRSRIHRDFPDHGILGEEAGYEPGTEPITWVIDPIDGTKAFVAGVPLYTVLVAVIDAVFDGGSLPTDRVATGVIHAPAAGETVYAARGHGARWITESAGRGRISGQQSARVSKCASLRGARVMTTDWASLAVRTPELFSRVREGSETARTWGDAYGYLLVATGRADLMVDPIMSPWDIGPLPVVVEEAGGYFGTVDGLPILGTSSLASTQGVARELGLT